MTANTTAPEMTPVAEQSRTYHYPGGEKLTVHNVVAFAAPRSTHRLETAAGKRWVIAPGWLGIEIEVGQWTL